jgi:hypothetical protein
MEFDASSATKMDPSNPIATPAGRPQARLLSITKPVKNPHTLFSLRNRWNAPIPRAMLSSETPENFEWNCLPS